MSANGLGQRHGAMTGSSTPTSGAATESGSSSVLWGPYRDVVTTARGGPRPSASETRGAVGGAPRSPTERPLPVPHPSATHDRGDRSTGPMVFPGGSGPPPTVPPQASFFRSPPAPPPPPPSQTGSPITGTGSEQYPAVYTTAATSPLFSPSPVYPPLSSAYFSSFQYPGGGPSAAGSSSALSGLTGPYVESYAELLVHMQRSGGAAGVPPRLGAGMGSHLHLTPHQQHALSGLRGADTPAGHRHSSTASQQPPLVHMAGHSHQQQGGPPPSKLSAEELQRIRLGLDPTAHYQLSSLAQSSLHRTPHKAPPVAPHLPPPHGAPGASHISSHTSFPTRVISSTESASGDRRYRSSPHLGPPPQPPSRVPSSSLDISAAAKYSADLQAMERLQHREERLLPKKARTGSSPTAGGVGGADIASTSGLGASGWGGPVACPLRGAAPSTLRHHHSVTSSVSSSLSTTTISTSPPLAGRDRRSLAAATSDPSQQSQLAQPHYPPHFMRGSIIQLANGALKRVEQLRTEDFVNSADISPDLKIDSSHVVFIEENVERGTAVLGFAVGEQKLKVTVEATVEHPFFVFGRGWSSCSTEKTMQRYGLECFKLAVGDVCISLTQKRTTETMSSEATGESEIAAAKSPLPRVVKLNGDDDDDDDVTDVTSRRTGSSHEASTSGSGRSLGGSEVAAQSSSHTSGRTAAQSSTLGSSGTPEVSHYASLLSSRKQQQETSQGEVDVESGPHVTSTASGSSSEQAAGVKATTLSASTTSWSTSTTSSTSSLTSFSSSAVARRYSEQSASPHQQTQTYTSSSASRHSPPPPPSPRSPPRVTAPSTSSRTSPSQSHMHKPRS